MRRRHLALTTGALVAIVAGYAALHAPTTACHTNGGLPDPVCTPGAINPEVTQDTIAETICVPGYTATIRPPTSYTNALKRQQMAEYGLAGNPADYEEDHLISLALGGHPSDPRNLWPAKWIGADGAHAKDRIESLLHRRVCAGEITLAEAQRQIATDWRQVGP